MSKFNAQKLLMSIQKGFSKHSPEILTGLGIAGMVVTTILTANATTKAVKILEKEKADRADLANELSTYQCDDEEEFEPAAISKVDAVKLTWKCYIPAAATGLVSIGCLIGAQSANARRAAALATAYTLSETALTEFKNAATDVIGNDKVKEIKEKIAKDKVEKKPVDTSSVIVTGRGNSLCLDGEFGQYFESDIEEIRKAVNELNQDLIRDQYVSLNDFYDRLGVNHIKVGDNIGWNISKQGIVDVWFSSQIANNGRPCIVLNYSVAPQYDFDRLL